MEKIVAKRIKTVKFRSEHIINRKVIINRKLILFLFFSHYNKLLLPAGTFLLIFLYPFLVKHFSAEMIYYI